MKELASDDKFVRWWNLADAFYHTYYAESLKCRKYYDGEQLSEEMRTELKNRAQPEVVMNHIKPTIEMVLGTAAKLRRNISCIPRASDDNKRAFAAAQTISYVQDINDFNRVQLKVMADSSICGVGWYEVCRSTNITRDPIRLGWVDWREMRFDPLSKQDDLSDSRFVMRVKWVDEDLAQQIVPGLKGKMKKIPSTTLPYGTNPMYQQPYIEGSSLELDSQGYDFLWYNDMSKLIQLVEVWYRAYERRPVIYIGSQFVEFNQQHHMSLVEQGVPVVMGVIPVIRHAMIVGPYVMYDSPSPYQHGYFPYVPLFCFRDWRGRPYGLVKPLIDPQDEINKRRSKLMHLLNTVLVISDQDAVDDVEEARDELTRPDGWIEKRQGTSLEVIRHDRVSQMHYDLMVEGIQEIRQIGGQYGDSRGEETNARTGLAIKSRTINAQTSIASFFANNNSAMRQVAEMTLSLIKTFYTNERVIRLAGPEARAVTLNTPVQNPQTGEIVIENAMADLLADVVLADQPTTFSERQAIMASMSEVLKGMPPVVLLPLLPYFFDMMDVPNKDEMIQTIQAVIGGLQQNAEGQQDGRSVGQPGGAGAAQGQGGVPGQGRGKARAGGATPIPNRSTNGRGVVTFPGGAGGAGGPSGGR